MKPFFSYYGSKYNLSSSGFFEPPAGQVCEPFAGSACYSLFHNAKNVLLLDIDDKVCELWDFLINVSAAEITKIPAVLNDNIYKNLPLIHKNLIQRWVSKGRASPNVNRIGKWQANSINNKSVGLWGEPVKQRIIMQLDGIRSWSIKRDDYFNAPAADTYFIDPPYSSLCGKRYKHSNIYFDGYLNWLKSIQTQSNSLIICENDKDILNRYKQKIGGSITQKSSKTFAGKIVNEFCLTLGQSRKKQYELF